MADIKGFLKYDRSLPKKRDEKLRVNDYQEIYQSVSEEFTQTQAARCMDCGVPFCHNGCPLGNIIPDFNDAVYREDWKEAYMILSSTNNFPEFTGRICPAPCEASCVLGINSDPVTIEHIEKSIIEEAFGNGWVVPQDLEERTDKKVAVVGSGPAGMAASVQLNKAGHEVTLFERNDKIGGLLRYGIPDFKLEKWVIDRRQEVMEKEGINIKTKTNVGVDITAAELMDTYDAIVLTGGSTIPRDLPIKGRNEIKGIHFAMDFLEQSNKIVDGVTFAEEDIISAKGKHVVVIGGGDTGADCVGTSHRQGAESVTQIELLAKPPSNRHESTPWPLWPMMLRTSTSHEEGGERKWALLTKEFVSENGQLTGLKVVQVKWELNPEGIRPEMTEIPGTEEIIPCDVCFLAIGFLHGQHEGLLNDLNVEYDARGNVSTNDYQTEKSKIFAAGDMRRGQSLVVWAISEGREAAVEVDKFLTGKQISVLETKDESKLLLV